MKTVLVGRLKKWMFFAAIGCIAYFVGYVWGIRNQTIPGREPASVSAPATK
ncbi:hypothetical protein [Bdellovibrio bacteriovorus]|uniref:hypothetical protein n=1 Tax=Bdellovibrio bacteriovorus TaxID=959 RepID=UPI000AC0EF06|nr:hypothetical protein [Bdellovibrio bacteriovorus]